MKKVIILIAVFLVSIHSSEAVEKPLKVIVCAGQSNMVGKRGDAAKLPAELKAEQKSLFWDGKDWVPLKPGVTEKKGFGPDNLHYTGKGMVEAGRKAAEAMLKLMGVK